MKQNKLLLTLIAVILFSMVVLVWFFPTNGDFRTENPFWNGLATFNSHFNVTSIDSLDRLPLDTERTALLIVPYEQFSSSELELLKSYVSNGGTLVVLDDYGFGNQVLKGIGLDLTFTGKPLLDPLFNYRNKFLPKITDFADTPMATNVSSVFFNHPSSLSDTPGVTVAAYSSRFSFLDVNGNDAWDADEPTGPLPVVAYCKVDQGYVVAVADPSLLINGMIELEDTLQFIDNVAGLQGTKAQIFVDQSHLPKAPLDDAKEILAAVYGVVASPLGALSLIAVILAISLKPILLKGEKLDRK